MHAPQSSCEIPCHRVAAFLVISYGYLPTWKRAILIQIMSSSANSIHVCIKCLSFNYQGSLAMRSISTCQDTSVFVLYDWCRSSRAGIILLLSRFKTDREKEESFNIRRCSLLSREIAELPSPTVIWTRKSGLVAG